LDQHFGIPPTDWVAGFKEHDDMERKEADAMQKNQSSIRATQSKPSLAVEKYAGIYSDAWYARSQFVWKMGCWFSAWITRPQEWPICGIGNLTRSKHIGAIAPLKTHS